MMRTLSKTAKIFGSLWHYHGERSPCGGGSRADAKWGSGVCGCWLYFLQLVSVWMKEVNRCWPITDTGETSIRSSHTHYWGNRG